MLGIVAEAEILDAADLVVGGSPDDCALVIEHLPEFAKAGPIGGAFDDQPVFFLSHFAIGRDRPLALAHALLDVLPQHAVELGRLRRAAKRGEDRADVVDGAEVAVYRRGPVL